MGDLVCASERLTVRFHGPGAGVGELSWGQREIWQTMRKRGDWMPIGAARPLPPGKTVDGAVADLRFVMSRYPTMRTRLLFGPEGPQQVVADSGEIDLEVVDADRDADPAQVAVAVWQRYYETGYDFATDWPVRMAVVRHRGKLTHRVWMMCHLVTDGTGGLTILDELANQDTVTGATPMPPLGQVAWQGSPAGVRHSRLVLAHWEKLLRGTPPCRFPAPHQAEPLADAGPAGSGQPARAGGPGLPGEPRHWHGKFESPGMYLAVPAISARTGVESQSVLLALFAVALARVTGMDPVVFQIVVSNRFRPGLARTVSPIMQNGLCLIEVTDTTVDELVTRTRRRAMAAYKHAYYDPVQRDRLLARLSQERGEHVDIGCFFNDRRLKPRGKPGPPLSEEQIRTGAQPGRFEWTHRQDRIQFPPLYLNVEDVMERVMLQVSSDTHRVSPPDAEACLRVMEKVGVAAALDPATRTGI